MQLDNWLHSIAEQRWPILPDTLKLINTVYTRHADLINFTDLANLTLSDPLLLFDLLRVIGSSRALQRTETMPSVEQSMILMGLESVQSRFTNLNALTESARFPAPVLEAVGLWLARGRVAALTVKGWLSLTDETKIEDCFIAALLYNLPACFYLLMQKNVPARPLLQAVSECFETDYPKVLERFVQDLRLPTLLLGLLGSGNMSTRKQLLRLAIATANSLEGHWRSPWLTGVTTAANLVNTSFNSAYHVVLDAVMHVAHSPRAVEYFYPARELLFLPEFEPQKAKHSADTTKESSLLAQEKALKSTIRYLVDKLGFTRVLYLHYIPELNSLKLRYQIGVEEDNPVCRQAVSLQTNNFFALLTSKPQSFHAAAAIRAKLTEKYKDDFLHYMGGGEFAAATVFLNSALSGVLYVDQGVSGKSIDEATYQHFKKVVSRMTHLT